MSWAVGFDSARGRDIGYGVPAFCDHPRCSAEIDRGLAYRCGGHDFDLGCGLYFCPDHCDFVDGGAQLCARCRRRRPPFDPKPDHPRWIHHTTAITGWLVDATLDSGQHLQSITFGSLRTARQHAHVFQCRGAVVAIAVIATHTGEVDRGLQLPRFAIVRDAAGAPAALVGRLPR